MKNFIQYTTAILLALVVTKGSANDQAINNPFEIKNRLSASTVIDTTSRHSASQQRDTVIKEEIKQDFQSTSKNPFEVNHIPLRKKDVLQRVAPPSAGVTDSSQSNSSISFIYWLSLVSLILIALAIGAKSNAVSKITKSIFNENLLKLEHRDSASLDIDYILLYIVFFINGGIFLTLLQKRYFDVDISIRTFGLAALFLIVVYLIRHLTMNTLAYIFPFKKESTLYSFTIQVYNIFIGMILVPINLVIAFADQKIAEVGIFIAVGAILLIFIIRLLRGLTISLPYILTHFILFFVYLCAVEIAPILVLVKLLNR